MLRKIVTLIFTILVHFAVAKGTVFAASLLGGPAPLWPALGVGVSALLLMGDWLAPAVFVGALMLSFSLGVSLVPALVIATGSTLETVVCVALVRRLPNRHALGHEGLDQFLGFALSAVLSALIGATFGTFAQMRLSHASTASWSSNWTVWWAGDVLGVLLVTPLVLSVVNLKEKTFGRFFGLVGLAVVVAASSWFVFSRHAGAAYLFALLPLLFAAAVRFGTVGARLSAIVICVAAVIGTHRGVGPFAGPSPAENFIHLQVFLGAVVFSSHALILLKREGSMVLPGIVLILGWLGSGVLFYSLQKESERFDAEHFDGLVTRAEQDIRQRMTAYEEGLRAGVALFAAHPSVDEDAWRVFVHSLDLSERYPGIRSMGVAFPVSEDEKAAFEEANLKYAEHEHIYPLPIEHPTATDSHIVVTYLEPQNPAAIGVDVGVDANRRRAFEEARDSGEPTLSVVLQLAADGGRKNAGFLMVVPVYERGASVRNVEERRSALRAWILGVFIRGELLEAVLEKVSRELNVDVYQGDGVSPASWLYGTFGAKRPPESPDYERATRLVLASRTFTLGWKRHESFLGVGDKASAWASAAAALGTVLLAGLVMSLQTVGRRANEIANERTAALEASRDRVEAQAQALQSALAAADDASRAKSDFLATMSHEIRTPMNGVLGVTTLLLDSKLDADQRDLVTTIKASGEALLTIINDILDFSRIEAGRVRVEPMPFDLEAAVRRVHDLLKNEAEEKGLDFTIDYSKETPRFLVGDKGRISQVLVNLVGNAIKFTSEGSVTIRVEALEKTDASALMRLEVLDTGIGIPTAAQDRLFQKFSQADSSTTRKFGGTGLGLAISKQLTELMGGAISFKSEVGSGSKFFVSIRLPLATEEQVINAARNSEPMMEELDRPREIRRVLLAEDNAVNQKVVVRALKKLGCMVDVAQNGREAVSLSEKIRYDLILMDVQMPEIDGFEATRTIRSRESNSGGYTPIVAMTANAMPGDREQCIDAGMDEYLTKPVTFDAIKALLGDLRKFGGRASTPNLPT